MDGTIFRLSVAGISGMKGSAMNMQRLRFSGLVLSMLWLTLGAAAAETYQALRLEGSPGPVFAADGRLALGSEGTLELWLAANADSAEMQCIVAHGDPTTAGFAVLMHPERRAIYLATPDGSYSVDFDFSDGVYHHVVFSTSGGLTSALIDGEAPTQPGDGDERIELMPGFLPFGSAPAGGHGLALGCDKPAPFNGWLATLRLWDKALSADEIDWAKRFRGYPDTADEPFRQSLLEEHLVAYATFTDAQRTVRFTEPALERATVGAPSPAATTVVRGRRLTPGTATDGFTAIFAKVGQYDIEELRFEYPGIAGVPDILPPRSDWTPFDAARLEATRRQIIDLRDDPARREALITEAVELQIGYDRRTEQGRRALGIMQWQVIEMRPHERLTRVAVAYNPHAVQRLALHTDRRALPLLEAPSASGDVATLELPDYALLEGIEVGTSERGRLMSLGLSWSMSPVPEADRPLLTLAQGLWVAEDSCPPRLADERARENGHARPLTGISRLHGLYTTPTVARFMYRPDRQTLALRLDHFRNDILPSPTNNDELVWGDQGSCGKLQLGYRAMDSLYFQRETFDGANPNRLFDIQTPPSAISLVVQEAGARVRPIGPLATGDLVRAPAPAPTSKDKIAWGGTFALPHRPANVKANFVGYDITHLDPHNFLRSHGLKQLVFAYPDDESTDYQTTDNNLIVPHGVYFKSDLGAVEDAHTIMVAGALEYKHAWSVSLGFNIGFGLDGIGGAFSANGSYGERSSNRTERQVVTSITRTAEVDYALIADRARIELSPAFEAAVLGLRDRHLVDLLSDEQVGHLIRLFGTHYPYAVSYGGMAFLETDYSEEVVDHMHGRSMSFEEQASLSLGEESKSNGCGCEGGGGGAESASFGISGSVEDDAEVATQVRASIDSHIFGTYGGSVSRGEGWSLSPGQEVPLFFDLRPLSELLSPIFFDDPIVWDVLAPKLHQQIRLHLQRAIGADHDAKPGWYDTNRENQLRRHEPRVFDHAYKAGG